MHVREQVCVCVFLQALRVLEVVSSDAEGADGVLVPSAYLSAWLSGVEDGGVEKYDAPLLCTHAALDPRRLSDLKHISRSAAAIMQVDASRCEPLCSRCVLDHAQRESSARHVQSHREMLVRELKTHVTDPSGGVWASKKFVSSFTALVSKKVS